MYLQKKIFEPIDHHAGAVGVGEAGVGAAGVGAHSGLTDI